MRHPRIRLAVPATGQRDGDAQIERRARGTGGDGWAERHARGVSVAKKIERDARGNSDAGQIERPLRSGLCRTTRLARLLSASVRAPFLCRVKGQRPRLFVGREGEQRPSAQRRRSGRAAGSPERAQWQRQIYVTRDRDDGRRRTARAERR